MLFFFHQDEVHCLDLSSYIRKRKSVKILVGDRPPQEALRYTDYMPFYGWLYHGVPSAAEIRLAVVSLGWRYIGLPSAAEIKAAEKKRKKLEREERKLYRDAHNYALKLIEIVCEVQVRASYVVENCCGI